MIGGLLFIALLYLFIIIVTGRTPYPIYAAFYNMAFGAVTVMIPGAVTGNNVVGNGLSTAALSIGQLWMFGMMLLKMPYERH